jgi:hypothetical protein
MRKLRNALLVAAGLAVGACATQTFRPEKAPEYVVTRDPTPFYLSKPRQEGTPDAALSTKTRVKLLRKQDGYSLVLLKDSRKGYVANAFLRVAPFESPQQPSGSSPETAAPPRSKRRAAPSPTSTPSEPVATPASEASSPTTRTPASPDRQAPPEEVPSPTPAPEPPLEKPKFRL